MLSRRLFLTSLAAAPAAAAGVRLPVYQRALMGWHLAKQDLERGIARMRQLVDWAVWGD